MATSEAPQHPQVVRGEPSSKCQEATLGWYAATTVAALFPLVITFMFGKVHDPAQFVRHGELLLIAIPVSIIGLLTIQGRTTDRLTRGLFWGLIGVLGGAIVVFALHTVDITKVPAADWDLIHDSVVIFVGAVVLGGACVVAASRGR